MTNGEKLKEIFPYLESDDTDLVKVLNIDNLKSWWNAEYKEPTTKNDCENCIHNKGVLECDMYGCKYEPTTKNDLGVECISKQAALDACHNFAIGVLDEYYEKCLKQWIIDLPSVTPQEPRKGHWILTDVEGNKIWHCHCSECGKDPQDYVGGSENWWLIKSKLPKFCSSCGSDNREVEE